MASYLTDAELDQLKVSHPEMTGECPTCRGEGAYIWQGTTHKCDCAEQKRLNTKYSHAGIGLAYQRMGWGDVGFEVPREVMTYLDNLDRYVDRGMGLYLVGPVGSGKTLLGTLILKDIIKAGYDAYCCTFAQTVENLISTWSDQEERKRYANRFMRSRVLLLDDLGKEMRNSFRNTLNPTTFDFILRTRVQEARPTILTTNLSSQEVHRGYGSAALSLLVEQSVEVPLGGADFRPSARARTQAEIDSGEIRPIV